MDDEAGGRGQGGEIGNVDGHRRGQVDALLGRGGRLGGDVAAVEQPARQPPRVLEPDDAASLVTSGLAVTASFNFRLAYNVRLSSSVEVTDIFRFDFRPCSDASDAGCAAQSYVGTQGPYVLSSGAGTPKWRGNWSTSLEVGPATLTGTAYYTSGYRSTAEDLSGTGTGGDCSNALYDPNFCRTRRYIQADFVGSYKVSDNFTFYLNLINAFNAKPPFNPANYAAINYNPTFSYGGIVGRMFRAGVKVGF